jgi:glycosyltransferase involved in cell wall biosynthesis
VLAQLAQADVFALACVVAKDGDRDGMPVALAEAMAMETPVVSTDLVGIAELVQPGAGHLIPPNDAHALANALHAIAVLSEAERREMGRRARRIVAEQFELYTGIRVLADLFETHSTHGPNAAQSGLKVRPAR